MTLNRRELLRLFGASATAWLATCGDNRVEVASTAVLDPDETSVVVAIWSQIPDEVATVIATVNGAQVARALVALAGEIGRAELTGLAPDTAHEVTIEIGSAVFGPHLVRTAPRASDPRPVRAVVSADCDPNPSFTSGLAAAMVEAAPDVSILIGDFPYTDNGPPAHTVPEYRARHVELRNHLPIRALHQACGMYAIYDDHEVRNDWDGGTQITEPARYAAALQVWDEFFPQRATTAQIRYRRWRWGANLECFQLDCRRFRSRNSDVDDAKKTMLGAAQLSWLIESATTSTATFKLILTSVPLDFGTGDDHWAAFKTERDAMFAALVGTPGVVFVSGDQHFFAAHRHAFGIREFQVGPLARGLGTPGPMAPGVLFRAVRFNAGVIDVSGDQFSITGMGADGMAFYRETLTPADLTPSTA